LLFVLVEVDRQPFFHAAIQAASAANVYSTQSALVPSVRRFADVLHPRGSARRELAHPVAVASVIPSWHSDYCLGCFDPVARTRICSMPVLLMSGWI